MSGKIGRQAVAQGKLDGLCGIYSIINSVDLIENWKMDDDERKALFVYLVDLLDDGRGIGSIIHHGINFRDMGKLIDVASRRRSGETGKKIKRQTAMKQIPDDIGEFWSALENHVDLNKRQVAILGIGGKYEHWTVVKSVKPRRLELQDSDGLVHLDMSRCRLTEGEDGMHVLWPTQCYLLWPEEDKKERL
ncbi:hypothetical protein [Rhizobium arsenicireducens]